MAIASSGQDLEDARKRLEDELRSLFEAIQSLHAAWPSRSERRGVVEIDGRGALSDPRVFQDKLAREFALGFPALERGSTPSSFRFRVGRPDPGGKSPSAGSLPAAGSGLPPGTTESPSAAAPVKVDTASKPGARPGSPGLADSTQPLAGGAGASGEPSDQTVTGGEAAAPPAPAWAKAPPHDRLHGFPAGTWGVELGVRFLGPGAIPLTGRHPPWWLRSLSLPTWLAFRMSGTEARLELGFADADKAAAFARDFGILVRTAHHASRGGPLVSGKRLETFKQLDRLFGRSEIRVAEGTPEVVVEGPLSTKRAEWVAGLNRAASWVERESSQESLGGCREQRIAWLLACEMWQLDRGQRPPREAQRLVDAGLLDVVPVCPAGGRLEFQSDFSVHCSRHPRIVSAPTD